MKKRETRGQRSEARKLRTLRLFTFAAIAAALSLTSGLWPLASSATPIATDSRIKTFVFNANEVYSITTHYGYQSNVEFGTHETIDTVSIGDRVGWQIIPAGRRLFIRAMEENAHTNMTVVTSQRAYQFDLRSSSADAVFGSEELTYVVRFFYPDDRNSGAPMPVSFNAPTPLPPVALAAPAPAMPLSTGSIPPRPALAATSPTANYRYTFSGPNTLAPLKIYDDGRSTYFKLPGGTAPQVAVITAAGQTLSVPTRRTADGLLVVDVVAPRFSLQQAGQQVIVYNEAAG
ncbi:MAG: TrbG/VirB9 family P-type conjugative transfer protein [Rickettsiales bacterium]